MSNNRMHLLFLYCFSLLFSEQAFCQSFENFGAFQSSIEQFVLKKINTEAPENIHIEITQLDHTMTLPVCENEIKMTLAQPVEQAGNTVILECQASHNWVLYVPIHISIMQKMVVANRKINPSEIIGRHNTTLQLRNKNQLDNDYFVKIEDVEGRVAGRMIPASGVLNTHNVRSIPLVKKNEPITLILRHGTLQISMSGIAKTDGFLHDTIKILNPSSKKWVDGIVTGDHKAEIIQPTD